MSTGRKIKSSFVTENHKLFSPSLCSNFSQVEKRFYDFSFPVINLGWEVLGNTYFPFLDSIFMWRLFKQFFTSVCLELLDYPAGFWIYWVRVKKLILNVVQVGFIYGFIIFCSRCSPLWPMLDKMHENFSNLISLAVQLGAERNETSQAASGLACFCNCHHKNLDHRKIMNHHFDNSKAVKKKVASI